VAVCSITNTDNAPSLTLNKVVVSDNGGTASESSWTLTANGGAAGTLSGPGAAGNADVVSGSAFKVGTYALSESGSVAGYANGTQYSCVKNGGAPVNGNSITLALGDVAVCTIVNDDIAPRLKVVKLLDPTDDPGKFNLQIDGSTAGTGANVGHNGTTGFVPVTAAVQYTVGETAGTGTSLDDYVSAISGDCSADGKVTPFSVLTTPATSLIIENRR
jgi:hypothetical protein